MQHQLITSNDSSKHTQINPDLPVSTPAYYQEQLEALLYQKAARGEDVEPCINALYYFDSRSKHQHIDTDLVTKVYTDAKKEISVFRSFQRIAITVFAVLGMIGVFNGAFTRHNPASVNTPSVQSR